MIRWGFILSLLLVTPAHAEQILLRCGQAEQSTLDFEKAFTVPPDSATTGSPEQFCAQQVGDILAGYQAYENQQNPITCLKLLCQQFIAGACRLENRGSADLISATRLVNTIACRWKLTLRRRCAGCTEVAIPEPEPIPLSPSTGSISRHSSSQGCDPLMQSPVN